MPSPPKYADTPGKPVSRRPPRSPRNRMRRERGRRCRSADDPNRRGPRRAPGEQESPLTPRAVRRGALQNHGPNRCVACRPYETRRVRRLRQLRPGPGPVDIAYRQYVLSAGAGLHPRCEHLAFSRDDPVAAHRRPSCRSRRQGPRQVTIRSVFYISVCVTTTCSPDDLTARTLTDPAR